MTHTSDTSDTHKTPTILLDRHSHPRPQPHPQIQIQVHRYSIFEILTFSWLNQTFKIGALKALEENDLNPLKNSVETICNIQKMENKILKYWKDSEAASASSRTSGSGTCASGTCGFQESASAVEA